MKRAAAACAALLLAACTGGGHSADRTQPTLPPTSAFKDVLLAAAVKTKLAGEDIDSTTRVHVAVHDGFVTLSGRVPTAADKRRVAAAARSVQGVTGVDDRLGVGNAGPSAKQSAADLALAARVEAALLAQAGVNIATVKVSADHGVVTLAGRAPTPEVKTTLLTAARGTAGVRNVVDRLAVK